MIPDVGAGAPWTALWFLAALFLLGLTIISGGSLTLLSRALNRRDTADAKRDERLADLDTSIREQELKSLERDVEHQREIHGLQVEMLRCQKECSARSVTKEEYLGDFLRIQNETRDSVHRLEKDVSELVTRVHARIDGFLGSHDTGRI